MSKFNFKELVDPVYIGDGLYVGHDGYQIWVVAYDGVEVSNAVAFEEETLDGLFKYCYSKGKIGQPESSPGT